MKIKKILLLCMVLTACLLQGCASKMNADWVVINNSGEDIDITHTRMANIYVNLKNGETYNYFHRNGMIDDKTYVFEDIHDEIKEVKIKYLDSGTEFIYNYDGRYEPGHQFFNKRNWEGRTWRDSDRVNYKWLYQIEPEDIQGN